MRVAPHRDDANLGVQRTLDEADQRSRHGFETNQTTATLNEDLDGHRCSLTVRYFDLNILPGIIAGTIRRRSRTTGSESWSRPVCVKISSHQSSLNRRMSSVF